MTDMNDFNQAIIDEFRANDGRVGGGFEGAPMVLLHHVGAKSGVERVAPLVYRAEGEAVVVFGSKGGAPSHPHWFLNLLANPETVIELGAETIKVRARVADGDERDRIWSAQKQAMPGFAEYEQKIAGVREIPVVILERLSDVE